MPYTHARRNPFWRLFAANVYDVRRLLWESRFSLVGFSLLAVIGTWYFLFGYNDYEQSHVTRFTPISALYETLRLLVFQSGLPLPQNDLLGCVLFFLLPLLGLALVFQSVLNFGRLLLDKGSRQEAWQVALASTYREHVIVVGLGRIGYRLMTQLQETGYEVVVIERDWSSEFVATALARRVPVVLGDARQVDILEQAGLRQATGLVVTTSDDLLNIEIALLVRRERASLNVVMRIFDDELDSGLERGFGPNSAFSTSALAAPTLAAAAVSRNLLHVFPHGGTLTGLSEITIERDSLISGFIRTVELSYGVLVLQHRRDGRILPVVRTITRLEGGDQILILGPLDSLEQVRSANQAGSKLGVLKNQQPQMLSSRYDTVIVCGLGKIGYRVLLQLHQLVPRPEIVIVSDGTTRPQFLETAREMGVRIVQGDARDADMLLAAGLERAYSVVATTSDALVNIQIGLAARRLRADVHVVLRVFSDALAERLALLFGIHTVYSASELAAPTLAANALAADISHGIRIGDELFGQIVVQIEAAHQLGGYTIDQLRAMQVQVLAIQREGITLPLPTEGQIEVGDQVDLLAPLPVLDRLRASRP